MSFLNSLFLGENDGEMTEKALFVKKVNFYT